MFRNWSFAVTGDYGQDHTGRTFNDTVDGKLSTGFTNDWTAALLRAPVDDVLQVKLSWMFR